MFEILNTRTNLNSEVDAIKSFVSDFEGYENKILIYNLSFTNLIKSVLAKIMQKNVYWYRHECTSIKEKLENNSFIYAVSVALAEQLFKLVATKTCTGSPIVAKNYNINFCPLLKANSYFSNKKRDIDILFFGREDARRSPTLLATLKKNSNLKIIQAGGPKNRVTEEEKKDLFLRSKYVLNRYTKKIGQSGITPEALSLGCIVVVSEHDYVSHIEDLRKNVLVISSDLQDDEAHKIMEEHIKQFNFKHDKFSRELVDRYFGKKAFKNYWAPFLDLK